MTKFTVEIYMDNGVVTKVQKAVDTNFQEPEFVVDTMFTEVYEDNQDCSSTWLLDSGGVGDLHVLFERTR